MDSMQIILDKICEVLDEAADKISKGGKPSIGELKELGELIDIKKNIFKSWMLEDEEGGKYSGAGDWEAMGRYDNDSSHANRGKHYVRGHYSRSSGRRRDNGRYSSADGRSEMMRHLEMALDSASEHDREDIRRFMRKLENA